MNEILEGQRIAYLRQHRKKDEDPFIAFKEVVREIAVFEPWNAAPEFPNCLLFSEIFMEFCLHYGKS